MKIKTFSQQYKILHKYFPKHKFVEPKNLRTLPEYAEGWFLIPSLRGSYIESLKHALDCVSKQRGGKFVNWIADRMDNGHLRPIRLFYRNFPKNKWRISAGDYYVIAAQTGARWKGKSVKQVREDYSLDEFGLNSYEVACILLSHPERLEKDGDLWIDCPGNDFSPDADGDFSEAPIFLFHDGEVKLGTFWVGDASDCYGSASGFVPQSKSVFQSQSLTQEDEKNLSRKQGKSPVSQAKESDIQRQKGRGEQDTAKSLTNI